MTSSDEVVSKLVGNLRLEE
jgi:hypothetical protein